VLAGVQKDCCAPVVADLMVTDQAAELGTDDGHASTTAIDALEI
jgi:hypothetical protein